MQRVNQVNGFILHTRSFRETSSIIEVFTADFGRLGLVAKGSKSSKSRWRGLLQPFRQLEFSWIKRSQLGTLTGADMDIGWPQLTGTALYCGFYLNELLMRLSGSENPDQDLYMAYGRALHELSSLKDHRVALRRFEKQLLHSLGVGLNLGFDLQHSAPVQAEFEYFFDPMQGPVLAHSGSSRDIVSGQLLLLLAADDYSDVKYLAGMRKLLQAALQIQLGGKQLASQKMLRSIS